MGLTMDLTKASKFLSLVLRHDPGKIGITLDSAGWVEVDHLLKRASAHGVKILPEELKSIVETNNKKRFAFSEDGKKIRANQGHSVEVDLGLTPTQPPDVLYHGTATRFVDSIWEKGLIKGSRHHVHLSADMDTAVNVGSRHGKPVVFSVDAQHMHAEGYQFFRSENGVWLTDHVPIRYLGIHKS